MKAIPWFHNKGDKENLIEHNSACSGQHKQSNTHYEARIYFAQKLWMVLFNVVKVTKYLS